MVTREYVGQKVQTFDCKMNKSWGSTVHKVVIVNSTILYILKVAKKLLYRLYLSVLTIKYKW